MNGVKASSEKTFLIEHTIKSKVFIANISGYMSIKTKRERKYVAWELNLAGRIASSRRNSMPFLWQGLRLKKEIPLFSPTHTQGS